MGLDPRWPWCRWEEGKMGERARVLFWKEYMDLEDFSLLYYLPFLPQLLWPNKLFNPKGVKLVIDKGLSGNDLKAKKTLSIPKNRASRTIWCQVWGLLPHLTGGQIGQRETCWGPPSSQSRVCLLLSNREHPPWDGMKKKLNGSHPRSPAGILGS